MESSVVTNNAFQGRVRKMFSKNTSETYKIVIMLKPPTNFKTIYKYCIGFAESKNHLLNANEFQEGRFTFSRKTRYFRYSSHCAINKEKPKRY